MMGIALGHGDVIERVVAKIPHMTQMVIAEHDPSMDALRMFAQEWVERHPGDYEVKSSDVVDWVENDLQARYMHLKTLRNVVALGRYFSSHSYDIEHSAGLKVERKHNQTFLRIRPDVLELYNSGNGRSSSLSNPHSNY
jgi:hypothetical protein